MNLSLFIARRYLVSKKTHNIINIISGISVAGVWVGTMALVVVLSVFNGFEQAVVSMFNVFDPDLLISPKSGKVFHENQIPSDKILQLPGVGKVTGVVEENALLRYKSKQFLATIKGVSPGYLKDNALDTLMIEGDGILEADSNDFALPGFGIAYYLNIHIDDPEGVVSVFVPDRNKRINAMSESSLRSELIRPSGIFSVQQDFDNKFMFVPLRFARQLLGYEDELTSIEIRLNKGAKLGNIQKEVEKLVGPNFEVKDRLQQQEILYKTMKSEKWAVFLILTFILLIATFNILGSITMLILDKRKDIGTLYSLGASHTLVRRIFFAEGLLITFVGTVLGIALGALICWIQMEYGVIKLQGGGSFIMSAYPVKMKLMDFILVFATVSLIGATASWIAVRRLSKRFDLV